MKNQHITFLTVLFVLVAQMSPAQQIASSWSINVNGQVDEPVDQHMGVVNDTGERYYINKNELDDGFNFVKLDQLGGEVWNAGGRDEVRPSSIVYHGGHIFILGTWIPLGGAPDAYTVLRMYEDAGTAPRLVWEHLVRRKDFYVYGQLLMADPSGDGVVITSKAVSHDGHSINKLLTQRISAMRVVTDFDEIDLGAAGPAVSPGAKAICVDVSGNVYITGQSNGIYAAPLPDYIWSSTAFVNRFNRTGDLEWTSEITGGDENRYGFDIQVHAANVYVLDQGVRLHPDVPAPDRTGITTLSKIDLATGDVIDEVALPSRIRDSRFYWTLLRKSLLLDPTSRTLFVGYDSPDPTVVTLKSFNTALDEQWSQRVQITTGAHFASMISPTEGQLAIAVNDKSKDATRLTITSFITDGSLFDRYEVPGGGILEMRADASGKIHVVGSRAIKGDDDRIGYFQQLLDYRPNYRAWPNDLLATPYVLWELYNQVRLEQWNTSAFDRHCAATPCNNFMLSMHSVDANWKEIIPKPALITLPKDEKFNTTRLSIQKKSDYGLVFEVDRTLTENGVSMLRLETDTQRGTFTVSSVTDGANVPLILSLINKSGKVIAELLTTAPGQKVFTDRVAEPVSYIRITAPPVPPNVSIYPNPSNGKFNVVLDKTVASPLQLVIYHGQGTKVHQQLITTASTEVNLGNALPGFYILKVLTGKLTVTKTLQIK